MKRILILLCLPMIGFGQTLIPDANFEQALINLGYDTPLYYIYDDGTVEKRKTLE